MLNTKNVAIVDKKVLNVENARQLKKSINIDIMNVKDLSYHKLKKYDVIWILTQRAHYLTDKMPSDARYYSMTYLLEVDDIPSSFPCTITAYDNYAPMPLKGQTKTLYRSSYFTDLYLMLTLTPKQLLKIRRSDRREWKYRDGVWFRGNADEIYCEIFHLFKKYKYPTLVFNAVRSYIQGVVGIADAYSDITGQPSKDITSLVKKLACPLQEYRLYRNCVLSSD
jgi:hypothetical protein